MQTADFDYALPPELIAQHPAPKRDESRLLVLHRNENRVEHRRFPHLLEFLRPGDVLVLNNSRVIPARLRGVNAKTGGQFEVLLLEENAPNDWWVMLRPGKRARIGTQIIFCDAGGKPADVRAVVVETNDEGHRRLQFSGTPDIRRKLDRLGEVPLPPYIQRHSQLPNDKERYQTVFARPDGSVAAPTAGLHFTPELLEQIRARGAQICFLTLHVGPGTFLPVKTESLAAHKMHEERFELSEETANLDQRREKIRSPRHRHRHNDGARARNRGRATQRKTRKKRWKDGHFHTSAVFVSSRGRAADEFSFAALDAAHAGERVRRAGRNARTGNDFARLTRKQSVNVTDSSVTAMRC